LGGSRLFGFSLGVLLRDAELRCVTSSGVISWQTERIFLREVLAADYVGVRETVEDECTITFGPLTLGHPG
jgi:hypothetical protein